MTLLYEVVPILYALPIVPLGLILMLLKYRFASRLDASLFLLLSLSYCFAIVITFPLARLPIPFSYYYRISISALWLPLITALFINKWTRSDLFNHVHHNVTSLLSPFLLLSSAYFLSTAISALATPADVAYIRLSFPLKHGTFFISCGGNSVLQNHHAIYGSSQTFGYDIEQLNSIRNRSSGFFSRNPKDYFIYSKNVYSPLNGTIVEMVNNINDGIPFQRPADGGAGNFVIIQSGEVKVLLAHMLKGSILAHIGNKIKAGDMIGQVGLSGDTMEPHLHIHAYKGKISEMLSGGTPVPILFDERFLRRSDIINSNK